MRMRTLRHSSPAKLFCLVRALLFVLLTMPAAAQPSTLEQGLAHVEAEAWPEAISVFTDLVAANPYDGLLHYLLGVSYSGVGNCAQATPRLEQAVLLGITGRVAGMRQARVYLASCAAVRGDTAGALAHLEIAWRHLGLRDFSRITTGPRFAALIGTEPYRALAGLPNPEPADRTSRWEYDLAYLDRLIRETHPAPFHQISEAEWAASVARVRAQIPTLSDDQVTAVFMQLMASVGDGHTALYPPPTWQLLPIWPVALADGWYIGAAAPAYSTLVGKKLVGAGSMEMQALETYARSVLAADNTWTARWLAQIPFQLAPFYQLAGAANPDGSVTLRVAHTDGQVASVMVQPTSPDHDPTARWAPVTWPAMPGKPETAPRWIRYADQPYATEWLSRERVVYIALNQIADSEESSFIEWGKTFKDLIASRRAQGVILDLRLNNGGNGNLIPPFLRPLLELPLLQEPGAFQLLTGPRSFSATTMLINELIRFTEAETVGWPTGGRPVHYGTETPFQLPMSKLRGSTSARLEVAGMDATDGRPYFAPQIAAWPTGENLRQGQDPVLDAALARIANRPR